LLNKYLPEGAASLRHYAYHYGPGRYYRPAYQHIVQAIGQTSGALLDVGCGPGWLSIYAAAGNPELDCVGIDSSETMIALANRNKGRRLNATFREMDAREIVYPEDTFEHVVCVQTMHHWEDPDAILAEIFRVLLPGGRAWLYAADSDAEVPADWIERRGFWPPDAYVQAMWRRHSLDAAGWEDILARLRRLGWASVDVGSHGFYRRVVAEKPAAS